MQGLPSLRAELILTLLRDVLADPRRDDFQIVHFSIQADHIHLIVEARDDDALAWGLRSAIIRLARRANARLRRRGRFWGDRHHRRELATPSEVRNALVYVLANARKHLAVAPHLERIDRFSTAFAFGGWVRPVPARLASRAPPLRPPTTWLLATGWRRAGGLLRFTESPR